jgi:IS1 family transposase
MSITGLNPFTLAHCGPSPPCVRFAAVADYDATRGTRCLARASGAGTCLRLAKSSFARRTNKLTTPLEPFGMTRYYTDGWGTYERHVDAEKHTVGKEHMQRIESKHINLRTRFKRLVRRTICFSKTERMHDLVIGLFINRYEFGRLI